MTSQWGLMIGSVTAVTASATQRARTARSRPWRLLSAIAASANFWVSCRASARPAGSLRGMVISAVSANTLKIFVPKLDLSDDASCHGHAAPYGVPARFHAVEGGLRLAIEKVQCETLDLRPGMRQVDGAGIARLEVMAVANVAGRGQADGRHACGNGRPDPARAVLDHEAPSGLTPKLLAANRKMSGWGFPRATMSALKTWRSNSASSASTERHSCRRSIELEEAMPRGM